MFTVLIAEKEHIDAIRQENKLFFEPFLKNKELAFCYWNPAGQNLYDSVPGLLDAVGRRKEWRAVIINSCAAEALKARNPFDTVGHSAISALELPNRRPDACEAWDDWESSWKAYYEALAGVKEELYKKALEYPLQKLATWLCFHPEDYILNDIEEKQNVHDWALERIGGEDVKPSVRLEELERKQYKRELRLKETLRRTFVANYLLNIAYPTEVQCISLRTAEKGFFDPDVYWTVPKESDYSSFADRNMYFDKMRFLVFDLLPRSHRNFRTDYIRFLATVLIFASNPLPGSAMQARRLYQLETEADETPLCTLVTSYDRKLAATAEVIDNEMEKICGEIPGELSDKTAEALFCTPKDIAVLLDESCDAEKVYTERDYGLFFDHPENELHKWNREFRLSEKTLAYIARQQTRAVKKSVGQLHMASEVTDVNISRLTPLQINDVREYTNAAEDEMVASIPPDLTDISAYTHRMEKESENVKKVLAQRMSKKTVMTLGGLCLGTYFACFLPFLFANGSTPKTVSTAAILCVSMLGILAAVMVGMLFALRSSVLNAVRAYNNTAHDSINDVQSSLKKFSRYLSAACNVRRGHSVQSYAEKNLDEYTLSLRIRKKHLEDIRKRRAYLAEEYQDYLGDHTFCDETMSRPYEYDFDQKTEYAYPAPFLAADCRQIEFISNGNFVTVPSSYVTRMLVRMEGIYEK